MIEIPRVIRVSCTTIYKVLKTELGTGLTCEFVPDFMQADIWEHPEGNSRPNLWEDTSYRYEDESSFN